MVKFKLDDVDFNFYSAVVFFFISASEFRIHPSIKKKLGLSFTKVIKLIVISPSKQVLSFNWVLRVFYNLILKQQIFEWVFFHPFINLIYIKYTYSVKPPIWKEHLTFPMAVTWFYNILLVEKFSANIYFGPTFRLE